MSSDLHIIDRGTDNWIVNTGAYRLPHAEREGLVFESGQKYQVLPDAWIDGQATLKKTEPDADHSAEQLHPKQPGSPQFDLAADQAAAEAAAKAFADGAPERARIEAERVEAERVAAEQAAAEVAAKAAEAKGKSKSKE